LGSDNHLQNDDCTAMIFGPAGKWNDVACDVKFDGVTTMCEKLLPVQQREKFATYFLFI
jgi:hypothetical protein